MDNVEWKNWFSQAVPPHDFENWRHQIEAFCQLHSGTRKMALVASGGTTVPLDNNAVRVMENFSTGERGAASTEYFLAHGYAIIFLHRVNSCKPYLRHLDSKLVLDELQEQPGSNLCFSKNYSEQLKLIWQDYKKVEIEGRLLWVPFTTLSECMWLLRFASTCLQERVPKAMVYMPVAISVFYLPQDEMAAHTNQSSAGPFNLELKQVPKMLGTLVSDWAPNLFIVTFKLETDALILLEKAHGSLVEYKQNLVIGNLLKKRRDVVFVFAEKEMSIIRRTKEEKSQNIELEKLIVDEVVKRHRIFIKWN